MDAEKEKELRIRFQDRMKNLPERASSCFVVYFGDGNTDEEAIRLMKPLLASGSDMMRMDILAAESVLADSSLDEFIYNLVVFEVGAQLAVYDVVHARKWLREKTELIKGLFEEAVQQHGGREIW